MGRIGARRPAAVKIYDELAASEYVKPEGLYTHFSSADCDGEYTLRQLSIFTETRKELCAHGVKHLICHTAATSAILNYPQTYFDMVRPGIAAYGLAEGFTPALSCLRKQISL